MEYFLLPLVSLAAFFLKGVTGTGTTTVVVAIGSLFIDPKLTVVLASFINIFGGAFLLTALWFLFRVPAPQKRQDPPIAADPIDLGIGTIAGFCGGFIGINAPPLVLHFSRVLDKRRLRRLLVLIFIPAAMAQTATFLANGLLDKQVMVWGLMMLPTLPAGVWLGNRTFHKISESMFRRILGLFLVFVSIRLILRGLSSLGLW